MQLTRLEVMYGQLEGTGGKFARDPTGYLSIEAGIFRKHGLEVSWRHVQGTGERYRRLESGEAHVSFVVGRASLQHFMAAKSTRILGCAMNSCPYYLVADPRIEAAEDLKGRTVACREGPARGVPFRRIFQELAGLRLGQDITLQFPDSDQDAFTMLIDGLVDAALLPRPYGFMAEEMGFKRLTNWPAVVDDPLPITIETTEVLWRSREKDLAAFLAAHREGIRYAKTNKAETLSLLASKFGQSSSLAAKTFDEYLVYLDERLTVDIKQLERLVAQVAPDAPGGAHHVADEWIVPGALSS